MAVVAVAVIGLVVAFRVVPSPGSGGGSGSDGGQGMSVGAQAPTNALPATTGKSVSLADLRGSKIVVYFYEGSG